MDSVALRSLTVVTVHGTNDSERGSLGTHKWWEELSPFWEAVRQEAPDLAITLRPFVWSGENSAKARSDAAQDLNNLCKGINEPFAIVAHSHGGNVVDEAITPGSPVTRHAAKASRVITVGTPFFRRRRSMLPSLYDLICFTVLPLAGVFVALVPLGVIYVFVLSDAFKFLLSDGPSALRGELAAEAALFGVLFLISVIYLASFFLVFRPALLPGFRRFFDRLAAKLLRKTPPSVLAVHHENDEAIRFLQRVQGHHIVLFKGGALGRTLYESLTAVAFLAALALAALVAGVNARSAAEQPASVAPVMVAALLLTLFTAGPLLMWILGGFGWAVGEVFGSKVLNPMFSTVGRKVAFGDNASHRLTAVGPASWHLPTRVQMLSPETTHTMRSRADEALVAFMRSHRWSLLAAPAEQPDAPAVETLLTWRELVHTSYFEQSELESIVAKELAS